MTERKWTQDEIDAEVFQCEELPWCEHCQNTGSIDCYCGGDLCICMNYGEKPCPKCAHLR